MTCACGCGRTLHPKNSTGWATACASRNPDPPQCSSDGCPEAVLARGLCSKCYKRWQVARDPGAEVARRKKYAEEHVLQIREKHARYVAENPEKVKLANRESQRRTRQERPQLYLWRKAKERSVALGLPFDIEPEDLVIPHLCPYLGIPLVACSGSACDGSPSVDKVIPELGYTKGNVRVISYLANAMKRNATNEQLVTFACSVLHIHASPEEKSA